MFVAAHRADWRNAPENSIEAIQNCIEMGVDIVEIDVRMTKDSVLVLMHDETIDRTTTGSGKLSNCTYPNLSSLYLKNADGITTEYKIPTFEQVMLACKGKILVNVDKSFDHIDLVYDILKKTNTINQAILKGDKPLNKLIDLYGDLLKEIHYMPIVSINTESLDTHVVEFITKYNPIAFEVIYDTDDSYMFKIIEEIKNKGIKIWVNTLWESLCGKHTDDMAVEDPDGSWGWVINNGANILQTDRPALMLDYLRTKGLHK
ncbi:glycerophosphodiester phosphodiesterase family protein [Plebeiibacterium sediminum]|uniref:Glycerophosphodiester phosphodiesterase family protein n=1 Tax=Plebeiibacterium sediminum TaxID=2992112 RepID=A0AAE3SH62_9BACT|nr:glycerophosphodiester phosphodiesterase family protein [Plebeiobacterium sediminum]MCW3789208.1 glycerophosphodiester phosphodiesterase family protein [Plebeiobacterium sediminum]